MEELIKRLRDGTTVPLMEERHAVADALEAQQARIAELLELLKNLHSHASYDDPNYAETRLYFSVEDAISPIDDLGALAAHDAEVKKAALLEAAKRIAGEKIMVLNSFYTYTADELAGKLRDCIKSIAEKLRRMAEGAQK